MRIGWIDTLKLISILGVIFGHILGGTNILPLDIGFLSGLCLIPFFISSGYTIKKEEISSKYINKKFERLMTPYFLTGGLIIVVDVMKSIIYSHESSNVVISNIIRDDLVSIFYASGSKTNMINGIEGNYVIGAIWFLPAMFFANIIFQLLINLVDDEVSLGVISSSISVLGYILGQFVWLPFSILSACVAIFFIWIGYEIKKRDLLSKIKIWYGILSMILVVISKSFIIVRPVAADFGDILLSVVFALSFSIILYYISLLLEKVQLFIYLGQHTLEVLCIHLILMRLDLHCYGKEVINIFGPFIIAFAVNSIIKKFKNIRIDKAISIERDSTIDILRGLLILLMMIGYFPFISDDMFVLIYSFHMPAFVILSGLFYKKKPVILEIKKASKGLLLPYLLYCVVRLFFYIITHIKNIGMADVITQIYTYILGMSVSKNLFTDIDTIGPVYFILMLFVIRIVYSLVDNLFRNRLIIISAILLLSLLGLYLGNKGFWLPWSIDIALYSLIFYMIGVGISRYNILALIKNNRIFYFVLVAAWASAILQGRFEIAVRQYGTYGISILGVCAATLAVYLLAHFINEKAVNCSRLLQWIGRYSIIFYLIHSMGKVYILSFLKLFIMEDSFITLVAYLMLHIFIGTFVILMVSKIKRLYNTKI